MASFIRTTAAALFAMLLLVPSSRAQEAELIAPLLLDAQPSEPLLPRAVLARSLESSAPLASLNVGSDASPVQHPVGSSRLEPNESAPRLAGGDLRLRLELPTFRSDYRRRGEFLRQVTLTRMPPGSLMIEYEGFHGFVVKKATQRLRSEWLDSLDDLYDAGTLDDAELRDALRTMGDAIADQRAGGRWWERTWWEHLPAEKGGAPHPLVYTIGERLEVVRLGPLGFTNDFKGKLDRIMLSLEPDSARVSRSGAVAERLGLARDDARVTRDDDPDDRTVAMVRDIEDRRSDAPLLRLVVSTHEEDGLLAGTGWKFRLRPAVRMNLTQDLTKAFRDVSLRAMLEWSRRPGEPTMIEIEGLVRFIPDDQDLRTGVQFTFLFF